MTKNALANAITEIERLGLFDPLYKTREREIRLSLEP